MTHDAPIPIPRMTIEVPGRTRQEKLAALADIARRLEVTVEKQDDGTLKAARQFGAPGGRVEAHIGTGRTIARVPAAASPSRRLCRTQLADDDPRPRREPRRERDGRRVRTAPQQTAEQRVLGPQLSAALTAALEEKPVPDPGPATRHRGRRRKLLGRKAGPRHAEDGEKAAAQFRGMQDAPRRPRLALPPAAARTGPLQPTFTPRNATGPQHRPRHASGETERILDAARRRADAVPVPPPPDSHPVTAAQVWQSLGRLRYPVPDSRDQYGRTPAYVAMMRVADVLTGTTSRYGYPAAHPVPVAPEVPDRGFAVTVEAAPEPPPDGGEDGAELPALHPGTLEPLRVSLPDDAS